MVFLLNYVEIYNPKIAVSKTMVSNNVTRQCPLHQPLVAMATIKVAFVRQYLTNVCFSLMQSQGIKCVHFILFSLEQNCANDGSIASI